MSELTTYFSSNIIEKVKGMFLYYDGRAITLVIASNLFCYGAGWVLSPDFHVGWVSFFLFSGPVPRVSILCPPHQQDKIQYFQSLIQVEIQRLETCQSKDKYASLDAWRKPWGATGL